MIVKRLYEFGMIILNQNMAIEQNYVTLILTFLLFILKLNIFYEDTANDVERLFGTSDFDGNNESHFQ